MSNRAAHAAATFALGVAAIATASLTGGCSSVAPGSVASPPASATLSPIENSPTTAASTEVSTAPETPTASPSPSASPLPTQDPNLLDFTRGGFVRRWTPGAGTSGGEALSLGNGYSWAIDPAFHGSPELVFELPAVAQISQITIAASGESPAGAKVHVATATNDDRSFTEAGTVELTGTGGDVSGALPGPIAARWLRFTIDRTPGVRFSIESIVASGTVSLPPASFTGHWALADDSSGGSDVVFGKTKGEVTTAHPPAGEYEIETLQSGNQLLGATCIFERDAWHGTIQNDAAVLSDGGTLNVVADGTLLVGVANGDPIIARRIAAAPTCDLPAKGKGTAVAVIMRHPNNAGAEIDPTVVPGFRYLSFFLPTLTAGGIASAHTAILAMSCQASKDLSSGQARALLDFVAAGHVLVIRDADDCSASDYSFIPYPFTTSATGARGAKGNLLYIADSSILGSGDPNDRDHYVDTEAYLKNQMQQLGDADIMKTDDRQWCGLIFAQNVLGSSGWVRAYARYQRGIIVYDGFDRDDLRSNIPQAVRLARLEYGLSPQADLPCNAHVASQLVVLQSVHRTIAFGKPERPTFHFSVERIGAKDSSNVTLAVTGEDAKGWSARLDRHAFTLGSAPQKVAMNVSVPANASAGMHLYTLTATDALGQSAQAAVTFDVNEALAKELQRGRARIYGIHFDVASARIQGQSEATIAQIAQVLREYPRWHMRVEGYTDSDGGAAYNLALSDRRAHSVVADLVHRYRVAAARLTAQGFGLTKPVASNATDAGKALNRRVELVRI